MTRDEIQALLPFLANDTLDGEERAAVEAALENDADLQAELAVLGTIRDTVKSDDQSFSPGEMGLARLMRDVEAAPPVTAPKWVARPRLWQAVAAVLLAALVGQTVLTNTQDTATGGFELASGASTDAVVAFQPSASEQQIRDLLLDAGLEITGGPSALGLYELGLLEGVDQSIARDILKESDLVESVEFSQK